MALADGLLADLDDIGDELANDANEQVIGGQYSDRVKEVGFN